MVYKLFIRPILEYGLQLKILNQKDISEYQRTQNLALRCMLGAAPKTSINAMHKLLQIEKMEIRNLELNCNFYGKLHNSSNGQIPAVVVFKKSLAIKKHEKDSLVKNFVKKKTVYGNLKNLPKTPKS